MGHGKLSQSDLVFREYMDAFGYFRASDNGLEPTFLNPEGDRLTRDAIEGTTRYRGFAEARYGLLPRMISDDIYMEGYERALELVSGRLLPQPSEGKS